MTYKKPAKLRLSEKTDWGAKWGNDNGPAACVCPFPAFVG